jgi:SAM-dependent methyltransferase
VATWRNATGHSLSAASWLEAHHHAKLPERRLFAEKLARFKPKKLVDLGCGTGLWLDLLNEVLPRTCEFFGVDSDPESLKEATNRSTSWDRHSTFIQCDLGSDHGPIPDGDLTLAFNLFPYLPNMGDLLHHLHEYGKAERVVVRQYDGDLIRIGPMAGQDREVVDASLRASLRSSSEFRHYDLDRAFRVIYESPFAVSELEFELTQRYSPFPPEFVDYFQGTVNWMMGHLSVAGQDALHNFLDHEEAGRPIYVLQADLVAVLKSHPLGQIAS